MRVLTLCLFALLTACAGMEKKSINYDVEGQNHEGFIASGAKEGEKKPGVLIVHEWWGHNDYAKKRAKMLAKQGYVAMSIDMYGDGKTADHPKTAGKFAQKAMSDFPLAKKRFEKALEILKSRDDVDTDKIAAIGYCFGGGVVLNMARSGVDLDLVASFHGSLDSQIKADKKTFKPKVLVFNGADDPMVKKESISSFKKEMKTAKVDYEFFNYEGAKHGFTNKMADKKGKKFDLPLAYDKKADKDSWEKLLAELNTL